MLLLQVIVGTAEEGGHVLELAVEIFSILPVSNLDMHDKPFSHLLDLVAEALDQHASVAFDLLNPIIVSIKPLLDPIKARIYTIKPCTYTFKACRDASKGLLQKALESLFLRLKLLFEVLN